MRPAGPTPVVRSWPRGEGKDKGKGTQTVSSILTTDSSHHDAVERAELNGHEYVISVAKDTRNERFHFFYSGERDIGTGLLLRFYRLSKCGDYLK